VGVACDSVALVDTLLVAVISMIYMRTKRGYAPCCSGPGPYHHVRLRHFSRDIAATPFPSVILQFSTRVSATVTVNTHETVCPASKGSLMKKVNVETVVGVIVGMGMWFMGASA
jgi:hypothetical protein